MSEPASTITINVNGRNFSAVRGESILDVARKNNIYIPTLCAHKDLLPFGGCRVCIVEVEGMRGLPTSCTTPVENSMIIRTDTPRIRSERREILRLILSEHPSSCLICDEREECKQYMSTIRKVGLTTGCRYCPSDGHCELQYVVEHSGLKEINYPIRYRQFNVEKYDPFYDRDYNLCILCGRCVRICKEVRGADTLAFKGRGPDMVIGPAYERTHLDAGCEFCGDCVTICPTGALAERANKWKGKAEQYVTTTCAFCGIGCQMHVQVKGGLVIGSLPAQDALVNEGQLCAKGRFCVTELVNDHRRLKSPYQVQDDHRLDISWDEAIGVAAERLSACPPDRFAMLVSPNCCCEDLYVAQKFARVVMGSNQVDTSARLFYGDSFDAYLNLMAMSIPLADMKKASTILCVGLDTRFARSVVGVQLRNASKRGARIISIHPGPHNLEILADKWIRPIPGHEGHFFDALATLAGGDQVGTSGSGTHSELEDMLPDIVEVAEMLRQASHPIVVIGSEFLMYGDSPFILSMVEKLAKQIGAGVVILPAQNNLLGSVLMGTYPTIMPGGFSVNQVDNTLELAQKFGVDVRKLPSKWTAESFSGELGLELVYLVGEIPSQSRLSSNFTIFQNMYPPHDLRYADLVLPAAAFTECDGTFVNGDGRIQRVRKAVEPPGEAMPDWQILARIAQKMGKSGFDFFSVQDVHAEIGSLVPRFRDFDTPDRDAASIIMAKGSAGVQSNSSHLSNDLESDFPFILIASLSENLYRGFPLSAWVEGARKLFPEGELLLHPIDGERYGVLDGDQVVVASSHFEKVWKAKILKSQPQGMLRVTVSRNDFPGPNPTHVTIRKNNV